MAYIEYPEQSDNPRETSRCDSPTEGNNKNTWDLPQSQHENPEVSINTGYPNMQDTKAGSHRALETNNPSYKEEESILTPQKVTLTPQHADSGFVDITQGVQVTAGVGKNDLDTMACAPVLDEFLKIDTWQTPEG